MLVVFFICSYISSCYHFLTVHCYLSTTVDNSVIYHGQAFYLQKQLNRWQFEFTVVKNLDEFKKVSNTTGKKIKVPEGVFKGILITWLFTILVCEE